LNSVSLHRECSGFGQLALRFRRAFTARFGTGPGPAKFDRICADNGIRYLLTAPYSPATTGKFERLPSRRSEHGRPGDPGAAHCKHGVAVGY
jgi:transposase InsO family protein